ILQLETVGALERPLHHRRRHLEANEIVKCVARIVPARNLHDVESKFGLEVCCGILSVVDDITKSLAQFRIQDRYGAVDGERMAGVVAGVMRKSAERKRVLGDVSRFADQGFDEIPTADVMRQV